MVQNEIGYKVYPGRGDTGPYAIDFEVHLDDSGNAKDVKVFHDDNQGGPPTEITGTCTFTGLNVYTAAAHVVTDTITLIRNPNLKQLSEYTDGDAFPATRTETDFDRIYFLLQYFKHQIDTFLKAPVSEAAALWLPSIANRRGKFFAWEDTDEAQPISALGVPSVPCTEWAGTLLDDTTLSQGQATLGIKPISVKAVTDANYVILDADGYTHIKVSTGGSDRTITLPARATNVNRELYIEKIDSGAGKVIVSRAGSDTINGTTSWEITQENGRVQLLENGTEWRVIHAEGSFYKLTDITLRSQSSPTANTWYNLGALSLTLIPGIYRLKYQVLLYGEENTGTEVNAFATLSKVNNTEDDKDFTSMIWLYGASATMLAIQSTVGKEKVVKIASPTTFYLNAKCSFNTPAMLQFQNANGSCIISADRIG